MLSEKYPLENVYMKNTITKKYIKSNKAFQFQEILKLKQGFFPRTLYDYGKQPQLSKAT